MGDPATSFSLSSFQHSWIFPNPAFPSPSHGLSYSSLSIEDDFNLNNNWDLYSKWQTIQDNLGQAANGPSDQMYMTYLSANGGSFPYFVASGKSSSGTHDPQLLTGLTTLWNKNKYPDFPRVGCFWGVCSIAFKGTNQLLNDWLHSRKQMLGIVMMDFPGGDLIAMIISQNY